MALDLLPAAITRASSLIEGFDFIEDLFQEVSINSRFAVRDNDRADSLFIKLNRTSRADDSIDVTEFAQAPERLQQQRFANPATSLAFRDTGRTKECFARAFVSGETDHAAVTGRDEDRHRFVGKANGNLVCPGAGKTIPDEFADGRNLKRLRATNVDAGLGKVFACGQLE